MEQSRVKKFNTQKLSDRKRKNKVLLSSSVAWKVFLYLKRRVNTYDILRDREASIVYPYQFCFSLSPHHRICRDK